MGKSLRDYCTEQNRPELLAQWHPTLNADLTPDQLTYGSHRRVWWRCQQGHEWQIAVYARTCSHSGCPVCAGTKTRQRPAKNGASLLDSAPEVAAQWHPRKNADMTPDRVAAGSHLKVWWLCEKGHEWEATVKSRAEGRGCPVCARRKLLVGENDLATTHPQLAAQWHPTRNKQLRPQDVVAGNRRKVWWQCEHGHEWSAVIAARVSSGSGCPVCTGKLVVAGENDLASFYPHLAAQWVAEKNGPLRPEQVSPYSNRRVWWQCEHGHQWQSVIADRAMGGSDCPYCAGRSVMPGFNDLQTVDPAVAKEWHPTMNAALTPEQVTVGSSKRVWWQCAEGHAWKTSVFSRTGKRRHGCPVCAGKVKSARQRYYTELEREANLRRALANAEMGLDPMVVLSAMTESTAR